MDGRPQDAASTTRRSLRPAVALAVVSLAIAAALVLGAWDGCYGVSKAPTDVRTVAPLASPAQYAWTVGDSGAVHATRNGGSSWSEQKSGTGAGLADVTFTDGRNGWAVGFDGYSGTVVATQDGGTTWTSQNPGTGAVLEGVAFSDPLHGWAVGAYGAILATATGGTYWSPQTSGTSEWLYDVAFSDARHGWAVGAGGVILATTNGGSTWSPQASGTTDYLEGVSCTDTDHAWAVGTDGAIVATANGGATWSPQTSGTGADLWAVTFVDPMHGWTVGWDAFSALVERGVILGTTDGGTTWTKQATGRDEWLNGVGFSDATHGWAAGRNIETEVGSILATQDGGATWTVQKTGVGTFCNAVAARRVFTPAAASSPGSARTGSVAGPSLALTWENGIVTTVYDVQNPEVAAAPITITATETSLPSTCGVQTGRSLEVAASLVFTGGAELVVPPSALSGLGIAESLASKLVAFSKQDAGAVTELPGRYDPATKKSTFTSESLSTTFILATDTKRPVAKALANAVVKRGKKATLKYRVADGRPVATVVITIAKGKRTRKTLRLGWRATNSTLTAGFTCRLPAGAYTYTVKATDRLGNASAKTAACTRRLVVRP
jgi:photosystem II stability/assembly factor-like uncharacterized protein